MLSTLILLAGAAVFGLMLYVKPKLRIAGAAAWVFTALLCLLAGFVIQTLVTHSLHIESFYDVFTTAALVAFVTSGVYHFASPWLGRRSS